MGETVSIVNLRGLENAATSLGASGDFEARFAKGELETKDLGVSLQSLGAGEGAPFAHRHNEQPEELYVVIAGSGTIIVDGVDHPVETWDAVRVPGPAVRSFAAGDDGIEYLAFGRIHPSDFEIIQLDGSAADGG
jgi:uncharacterized cupin superfamily protein